MDNAFRQHSDEATADFYLLVCLFFGLFFHN